MTAVYWQRFDPRAHYVYGLWNHDGELVYVGRSRHIVQRLNSHLSYSPKSEHVGSVTWVLCASQDAMKDLETELIAKHQPRWNVHGFSVDNEDWSKRQVRA
jgi:excinuclease UvrABC nuclease subunit